MRGVDQGPRDCLLGRDYVVSSRYVVSGEGVYAMCGMESMTGSSSVVQLLMGQLEDLVSGRIGGPLVVWSGLVLKGSVVVALLKRDETPS